MKCTGKRKACEYANKNWCGEGIFCCEYFDSLTFTCRCNKQ